ncbi:hypothetical protein A2Z33_04115 [Candidatus Gottesmanbacteria bacterium RBG_16_52_11]|uniref:Methyltransferase type 11 domain-containing protein n=1 Tax=Candidatus Gottesmanbacteria bacterium RBG_16_52_11 TaxID=1798374 RepID=A0A1F5YWF2_9BACT|nr:MAG: hypothetical protein A2Z33_04115 [Candidatus Gottesmanbacteria bacterium RBG_16_52_11]
MSGRLRHTAKTIDWGDEASFTGPQHYFRESLIIRTIKSVLPKGNVLDLGCGGGSLMVRLARQGYHAYGIDMSPKAVARVKATVAGYAWRKMVHVRTGDATKIPYPPASMDAVVAGETLEHVIHDRVAVSEAYRVLKPGGSFIITVPANPRKFGEIDRLAGHVRRYTRNDLSYILKNAGFTVERIFQWGFPLTNLWQTYLLLPLIRWRIKQGDAVPAPVWPEPALRLLSQVFSVDLVIRRGDRGDCLFAVARKNP